MQNSNNNLLASIAVFAELCNTENDIKSIISDFIKSVYALEKQWALNSYEATQLLKKHFDFDLPEAVVGTCLNSLHKKGFVQKSSGKYVIADKAFDSKIFSEKLNREKEKHGLVEKDLLEYFEHHLGVKIKDAMTKEIIDSFIGYLLDKNVSDQYSTVISSFVIEKSNNQEFVQTLNQIKEGLVLLTGLRYTDDLVNIGKWGDELTIYLDTELLFHAAGYNGEVYEKLFDDFYNLVKEINVFAQNTSQKKLIHLKYFESIQEEIDNFFYVAEKIIKHEVNLAPDSTAMEEICKGCSDVSDVLRKKAEFEGRLRIRGISVQKEADYLSRPEYNIEDKSLIEKYSEYDIEHVQRVLHLFTKINYLRHGRNRTSFEKCGHICMTGKNITLSLSQDLEIKNEARDIPFATHIYFVTNRIWFRLNKGLSKSKKLPSTLDIVTKAQIVLSTEVNRSVEKEFERLKSELKNGKINTEQAQEYYSNLREKARRPEEITSGNVQQSTEFIFEDGLEKYLHEKSYYKKKAEDGDIAIRKLNRIETLEKRKQKRNKKIIARLIYYSAVLLFIGTAIGVAYGLWFFVKNIKTDQDTPIGIYGFVFAIIVEILGILKYIGPLLKWIKYACRRNYIESVKNIV